MPVNMNHQKLKAMQPHPVESVTKLAVEDRWRDEMDVDSLGLKVSGSSLSLAIANRLPSGFGG
jgi:hypothetical protein